MNIEEIKKTVTEMDPALDPTDQCYAAAVVLLASVQVGTSVERVRQLTGYSRQVIRDFAKRLRENGVWKGKEVCGDWRDEKTEGVAFWCDVCVAVGWINRADACTEEGKVCPQKTDGTKVKRLMVPLPEKKEEATVMTYLAYLKQRGYKWVRAEPPLHDVYFNSELNIYARRHRDTGQTLYKKTLTDKEIADRTR